MSLFNITAINNSAVYQGGAIYKMYSELNLSSSLFINNHAGEGEGYFVIILNFQWLIIFLIKIMFIVL